MLDYHPISPAGVPVDWLRAMSAKDRYDHTFLAERLAAGQLEPIGMFEDGVLCGCGLVLRHDEGGRGVLFDAHVWVDRAARHRGLYDGYLRYLRSVVAREGRVLRCSTHADEIKWDDILGDRGFVKKYVIWEAT